jgi:hypothetical protein
VTAEPCQCPPNAPAGLAYDPSVDYNGAETLIVTLPASPDQSDNEDDPAVTGLRGHSLSPAVHASLTHGSPSSGGDAAMSLEKTAAASACMPGSTHP